MTTEPEKSPREIAGEIVARFRISLRGDALLPLAVAIESALNADRERSAKIAENHFHGDEYLYHSERCTDAIASAIRGKPQ